MRITTIKTQSWSSQTVKNYNLCSDTKELDQVEGNLYCIFLIYVF
jgi:hypothetical protein